MMGLQFCDLSVSLEAGGRHWLRLWPLPIAFSSNRLGHRVLQSLYCLHTVMRIACISTVGSLGLDGTSHQTYSFDTRRCHLKGRENIPQHLGWISPGNICGVTRSFLQYAVSFSSSRISCCHRTRPSADPFHFALHGVVVGCTEPDVEFGVFYALAPWGDRAGAYYPDLGLFCLLT
jgi:hypothetical protein